MTDRERAIEYLDWYFYQDDGTADKDAIAAYEELKNWAKQTEENADKIVKVDIYLLRKYKEDLMKDFKCETEFEEWMTLTKIFNEIVAKMNEEMPGLWYTYGFGKKINN